MSENSLIFTKLNETVGDNSKRIPTSKKKNIIKLSKKEKMNCMVPRPNSVNKNTNISVVKIEKNLNVSELNDKKQKVNQDSSFISNMSEKSSKSTNVIDIYTKNERERKNSQIHQIRAFSKSK
jgi:hypothetical protein